MEAIFQHSQRTPLKEVKTRPFITHVLKLGGYIFVQKRRNASGDNIWHIRPGKCAYNSHFHSEEKPRNLDIWTGLDLDGIFVLRLANRMIISLFSDVSPKFVSLH